jgi:hypothetical protein
MCYVSGVGAELMTSLSHNNPDHAPPPIPIPTDPSYNPEIYLHSSHLNYN